MGIYAPAATSPAPGPSAILSRMRSAITERGEAMVALARLADQEAQLRARVDQVTTDARRAQEALAEAREHLVAIERAAGPDGPSAQERSTAEKRLAQAERAAAAPWRERFAGAERAAADAHHEVVLHAAEHFDALIDELEENGRAAAEQVDHAAEAFLAATARLTEAQQRLIEVVALTGRAMRPHDITQPKSDQARLAVQGFVETGGEEPPRFRVREQVTAA